MGAGKNRRGIIPGGFAQSLRSPLQGAIVLLRGISRGVLRKPRNSPSLWLTLAAVLATFWHFAARAEDEPPDVATELIAEVRENVSTTPGREVYRFVPARMLEQGQVVYYTLRITNQTSVPLRNVAVVQPVPANTTYVADSASGPGAAVSFSVDGGHSYGPAGSLMIEVEGSRQLAQAAQYTHIRWQLRNPLAPGATALARFRATFR
jgi:uncharacterized repeat protein (TIGR01451 family)